MADLNGDGISDLLYADRSGKVSYFKRSASGVLGVKENIIADGKVLNPGSAASICMTDWNGDGLTDLIIGHGIWTTDYPLELYINRGTSEEYLYENPDTLKCNGEPIGATYPQIEFADLTGDGIRDLVLLDCFYNSQMGTDTTNLFFYENRGTDTEPLFTQRDTMEYNGQPMGKKLGTLDAVDLNGDGGIDLAVTGTGRDFTIYYGKAGTVSTVTEFKSKKEVSVLLQEFQFSQRSDYQLMNAQGRIVQRGKGVMGVEIPAGLQGVFFLLWNSGGEQNNEKIILR